jgi:uncharacterized protein YutE (UPF0331/DUF86 family)
MACGERLLKKLAQAGRAYEKLKRIEELEGRLEEEVLYEVSVKRFEYTYESLWKTVRLFLIELKGLECNSPVDCFRTLYAVGLKGEEETKELMKTIRLRNELMHVYDFSTAESSYSYIKQVVVPLFGKVLERLGQECEKSSNME